MLTIIVVYIIVGFVYLVCPKGLKLVLFLINVFLPDPVPYIDEFLMLLALIFTE